jgi:tetratricopeptide (TPR) repeat protein
VKKLVTLFLAIVSSAILSAQINTDRVTMIGRNALYFEDYLLAIQYFNQVIKAKPYLAEPYFYRAIAKFYLDDYKGAEEDCSLCIEHNPFYSNAYQLRADARQNQKDYDGALADYEISLKNNPDDKYILINMGIANIEKKDFDNAEKYLNRLIEVYPNYTQGILTRGSMYAEKKDTLKAMEDYNLAIEKDKYFAPSYSMRAAVYLAQKDYDKALADFDEAIKIDPLQAGFYINRGLARYYKNDLRGSMADYNHVIEMEPSNQIAHFNRALLRSQVGDDNKAIEDFNFVIQNEPENYIAYMNRGLLKSNIGDLRGAIADIDIVLKEYPDFYQGFYLRSEIQRKLNNLKSAEQDYLYARKVEQQTQRDAFAGKTKKDDNKTREKSDKTIDKFNLLVVADKEETEKSKYQSETRGKIQNKQANVDLEPPFIATYYEKHSDFQQYTRYNALVNELNKQNVLSRKLLITNHEMPLDSTQVAIHFASINEYSKLLSEQPNNKLYYFARGLDYMLVQDFASAIEDFTQATQIDNKFALAYYNLAVAQTKRIKTQESVPGLYSTEPQSDLSISMQLGGKPVSQPSKILDTDAKTLKSKMEYDAILQNYNKVLELSPDFTYAYYNRAEVKAMRNDFRAAVLDYNEALKRDPEFAEAYYNRGICRLRVKDSERGLDDLRKAGELGIVNAYSIIKRMTE